MSDGEGMALEAQATVPHGVSALVCPVPPNALKLNPKRRAARQASWRNEKPAGRESRRVGESDGRKLFYGSAGVSGVISNRRGVDGGCRNGGLAHFFELCNNHINQGYFG